MKPRSIRTGSILMTLTLWVAMVRCRHSETEQLESRTLDSIRRASQGQSMAMQIEMAKIIKQARENGAITAYMLAQASRSWLVFHTQSLGCRAGGSRPSSGESRGAASGRCGFKGALEAGQ
eukprot:SAG31_NODE_1561_length_7872_cov_2.787469_7_plen_121_part_00